jgi:signal transduction histidine kinase
VIDSAIAAAGWLVAVIATPLAMLGWRVRASTMESVARVTHELRGPLTAARLGLHPGTHGDGLSPARIRAIDLELARAGLALDDLAELRSRRPPAADAVEVTRLLAESVEAWRGVAAARGAALELARAERTAWVIGERLRLAQSTGNLIANAIEHGGGRVEIRCRVGAEHVRVEVIDGGPGLPAPMAQLIRRPRAGRGRRGRGLAIAAAVAASHGGRLAAAPSERGARLILELPLARGHERVAPAPGDGQPGG